MLFVVSEAEDLSSGYKHRMQLYILGGGTLISAMLLEVAHLHVGEDLGEALAIPGYSFGGVSEW